MKNFGKIIHLVIILAILLPVGGLGPSIVQAKPTILVDNISTTSNTRGYAPDRVIVKFINDVQFLPGSANSLRTGRASLDALFAATGVQAQRPLIALEQGFDTSGISQIRVLQVIPTLEIQKLVEIFAANPNVAWAEPDYLAYPTDTAPNDPHFSDQWGLAQIEGPAAWDVSTGSSAVPIAIVDSGIEATHPDLAGQMWVNPGEIAGNGLDDDNNGYIDDVTGWDFVNADNDPADDHGHGTQVAGVAAAGTDNGQGIAGVCWHCKLMPVKVMQASGVANYSDIAAGVLYAAQKGAKVINISLGGYSNSAALQAAVQTATETYGSLVIAGAGNDNLSTPFYPAAYESVLAVAGTDQSDAKAGLSNYGDWIGIAAPAVMITTTFQGGDYGAVDGTSYAAPFVAGVAGLLRSQNLTWSANTAQAQILHTADEIDSLNPGYEGLLGTGRVNANSALNTSAQPALALDGYAVDGIENGRPEPGKTVDLDIIILNDWADATNVQATLTSSDPYVTIVDGAASFGDIATYASGTNTSPFQFSVSGSAPYNHAMDFTLQITANGGYATNVNLTLTTASSVVYPPATITTQTWTNDKIYVINKETGIPTGETLTIQPGTEIRFDGEYSFVVAGELIADGTEEQPIIFTSYKENPGAGDWGSIRFLDSSIDATFSSGEFQTGSLLRYSIIEYGLGVWLEYAAPFISNNTFRYLAGVAANEAGVEGSCSDGILISGNNFEGIGVGVYDCLGGIITQNTFNNIVEGNRVGIGATSGITISMNRIVDCNVGMLIGGESLIKQNLLANNEIGLQIGGGAPLVISNTIVSNDLVGIQINSGVPEIHKNNLVSNSGGYVLENNTASAINATNNWWGTADNVVIQASIYDGLDEFGLGLVDHSSYLTLPEPTAPAYVVDVVISPDTTLGIQTATFNVEFSRAIEESTTPAVAFYKRQPWHTYDSSNSDLPNSYYIYDIAVDDDNAKWIGTALGIAYYDNENWTLYNRNTSDFPYDYVTNIVQAQDGSFWFSGNGVFKDGNWSPDGGVAHFDGTNWTVYDPQNSGLPSGYVSGITIDHLGTVWFGTRGTGVARFDGSNWIVYRVSNSDLPDDNVTATGLDHNGDLWFGTSNGIARFDGSTWTIYNSSNSSLLDNISVHTIVPESNGTLWFGTDKGALHFQDNNWSILNVDNSPLPGNEIRGIGITPEGIKWFGTNSNGVASFDGASWKIFDTSNSGLPANNISAIAIDNSGMKWFGGDIGGLGVVSTYHNFEDSIVDNAQWLGDQSWSATYDITSLVLRGAYTITIEDAIGTDGIEIAPTIGYTFTVDYAGAIGDTTPPPVPTVTACAGVAMDTLSAEWYASDPDSVIDLYSYAIGTTPGGSEVVNWTNTTSLSFVRSGLILSASQPYYISVKARNEGGLWSLVATPDAVYPGSGVCTTTTSFVYLPLVIR